MAPSPARPRLLVVDDQPQVREMLVEYFSEADFDVAAAGDVSAALARLSQGFDVVISDIRMPGQSGIDFLQRVRELAPALGVFLITGYPEMSTVMDAKCFGAKAYFPKPIDLAVVERRVREFLATRAADQGA